MQSPHDIAVSANAREIYVAELAPSPANALHKFELSKQKDLPTQTFIKQIYYNDKNFRISLIIMAAFAIPVLVAVIIGCIIRIKNIRMKFWFFFHIFLKIISDFLGKLYHLNAFVNDVKSGGVSRSTLLGDWMNRRKGFERLEQYSDGENEPLDSNIGDDSNNNSGDETITITGKQQTTILNNKNTTATVNMGESL